MKRVFAAGLMSAHGKQASVPAQPLAAAEADSPVRIAAEEADHYPHD